MKSYFTFTPIEAFYLKNMLHELMTNKDFLNYITDMKGTPLRMELKPFAKVGTKQAMYDFYHGVVLNIAIEAFTNAGYELMDGIKADYLFKSHCATSTMIRNGKEEPYLEDKSAMPKKRLHKYIADCIFLLESEFGVKNIPDAEEYKSFMLTGHKFKSVNNKR